MSAPPVSRPPVSPAPVSPAQDEQAVRSVVEAVAEAWAAGDATAFSAHYADQATATLPGFHVRSRADIGTSMAEAFAGPLHGSRRIHNVQNVRFPAGVADDAPAGTAVVITRSATVFQHETQPPAERWSFATWLLAQHAGRWRIEAYHECPAGTP